MMVVEIIKIMAMVAGIIIAPFAIMAVICVMAISLKLIIYLLWYMLKNSRKKSEEKEEPVERLKQDTIQAAESEE